MRRSNYGVTDLREVLAVPHAHLPRSADDTCKAAAIETLELIVAHIQFDQLQAIVVQKLNDFPQFVLLLSEVPQPQSVYQQYPLSGEEEVLVLWAECQRPRPPEPSVLQ